MGEKDQEVETSRCKINKSGYVMCRMVTVANKIILHI